MLLPPQADLIVLAIAGCGLVGTLIYLVRGGRLFWVVVGGAIFTAIFIALFVMTLTMTCKVVRVRGTSHVYAERSFLLGSKTIDLGYGKEVTLGTGDAETLIVNETDLPLTLRGEVYSQFRYSTTPQPRDQVIAPHSAVPFDGFVDHIGPDDPLPREVSSKSSTTTKYWLTW